MKKQVPDAEVHFLTKKSFTNIVESNPYIDKIITLGNDWNTMIDALKTEQYDYIIDLHHNLRTLRIKRTLKVKSFSFDKLNIQKWLLTALKINVLPKLHIVDRNLSTLSSFGVLNDGKGLDYFIPDKDKVKDKDIPASHHFGYIGIVIGAALETKKLPVHRLKELCSKINYPIILLGGPEDKANGDVIAATDDIKIYNSCGKFNLNESADLVRRSKLIITHDTGLMHIAAALKKPIVSIWGNTVPEFGMYPYQSTPVFHAQVRNLSCRPCSKIGHNTCPKGHFECMLKQQTKEISEQITSLFYREN